MKLMKLQLLAPLSVQALFVLFACIKFLDHTLHYIHSHTIHYTAFTTHHALHCIHSRTIHYTAFTHTPYTTLHSLTHHTLHCIHSHTTPPVPTVSPLVCRGSMVTRILAVRSNGLYHQLDCPGKPHSRKPSRARIDEVAFFSWNRFASCTCDNGDGATSDVRKWE
jgi:hypothetical protein